MFSCDRRAFDTRRRDTVAFVVAPVELHSKRAAAVKEPRRQTQKEGQRRLQRQRGGDGIGNAMEGANDGGQRVKPQKQSTRVIKATRLSVKRLKVLGVVNNFTCDKGTIERRTIGHLLSDWQGVGYIPDHLSLCSLVHLEAHGQGQVALSCDEEAKTLAAMLEIWESAGSEQGSLGNKERQTHQPVTPNRSGDSTCRHTDVDRRRRHLGRFPPIGGQIQTSHQELQLQAHDNSPLSSRLHLLSPSGSASSAQGLPESVSQHIAFWESGLEELCRMRFLLHVGRLVFARK
ncbi:hypothetical protein JOB18_020209 [Solea senegalensis]|uniref:Uncharacterized protein n=1 Tax=Solea senegalensis TaxID=28829 RepID=A0AAV6R6B8_SOLSE|nr:hypothetical protein JOB18_020209 [Solea senegalensis]